MNSVLHAALFAASSDNATATLTLRSGVQITGKLERPQVGPSIDAVHVKQSNGWATAIEDEIVAVEVLQ
jgi:hypothetical protein